MRSDSKLRRLDVGCMSWRNGLVAVVALSVLALNACGTHEEIGGPPAGVTTGAASDAGSTSSSGGGGSASDGGDESGNAGGYTMPSENAGMQPPDRANYPGIDSEGVEGAEQTVRFFFDARYYAYATGDVGPLESVTRSDCEVCVRVIEHVRESTSVEGKFITKYSLEPQKLGETAIHREGLTHVYYVFLDGEMDVLDKDRNVETLPAETIHAGAYLIFEDGRWLLTRVSWRDEER